MAATAVYVTISSVFANDAKSFSNIGATTAPFTLAGGRYGVAVIGLTFGTVTLEVLGPDGTTYLTALTAFSANGIQVADLSSGTYKVVIA